MITLFGKTVQCAVALLEYSQDRSVEDFDLSVPFTPLLIEDTIKTNYPDLVEVSKKIFAADPGSGVMLDHFVNEIIQPAFVSFLPPKEFFNFFGITAPELPSERYYATSLYTARSNEARFVYRNATDPNVTDIVDSTNTLLFHETIPTGQLPAELDWAYEKIGELSAAGIEAKVNHYKLSPGYTPKVYLRVRSNS
jgi:hypothetical protein